MAPDVRWSGAALAEHPIGESQAHWRIRQGKGPCSSGLRRSELEAESEGVGDVEHDLPLVTCQRDAVELPVLSWLPMMPSQVRIEEHVEGQAYTLRVEAPGINPAKDVNVVYRDGSLHIQLSRVDERAEKTHTEFHYGTYGRTVLLPAGVDEGSIHAQYRDGILEITAKLIDQQSGIRTIPVEVGDDKRAVNEAKRH